MMVAFIGIISIISVVYYIAAQYFAPDITTALYALFVIFLCAVYFIAEQKKRRRLIERAVELFEGASSPILNDESELSGLEHRVALSVKNAAAREENVTRSYKNIAALVSDISHQCKTPLSSIRLYSEMPPDERYLGAIHAQTEKLTFLLDALTKLSRCEGGLIAENLHPTENQLEALIYAAVNSVIASAEEKRIEIRADTPIGLCALFDMRWTAEALFNLLDNAVKYSPMGSVVTVTACEYEMFARIDVKDCGIGLPEQELTNIWKRFYRGKSTAESTGGVGIGLYLSRMILNSEGGRISVISKAGSGSTFSVFLPKS